MKRRLMLIMILAIIAAGTAAVMTGCGSDNDTQSVISTTSETQGEPETSSVAGDIQSSDTSETQDDIQSSTSGTQSKDTSEEQDDIQSISQETESEPESEASQATKQAQASSTKPTAPSETGTGSGNSGSSGGSKTDTWQGGGYEDGGLGGGPTSPAPGGAVGGSGGSKDGAMSGPGVSGSGGAPTEEQIRQATQEAIDVYGAKWRGKSEPNATGDNAIRIDRYDGVWDSSVGGWRMNNGAILFPDGGSVGK